MYICICNAITDRDIVKAAEQGARSPEDLRIALTQAGLASAY